MEHELRIGNLIFDDLNEVAKVCKIRGGAHRSIEVYENFEKETGWTTVFKPAPIPITEGWLAKSGLTQDRVYKYRYEKGTFIIHKTLFLDTKGGRDGWALALDYGQLLRSEIKFVHQLQNLYYALTGEELTISEPTKQSEG